MPFQLYVQPKAGEYMMQAAQSIAGNIQEARKKKQETEQKLGESDILLDYAKKHNLVSPDEENKYFAASADQKVGMADAWSKTIALNQAQELQNARLAQELQISQASQANQMAIAGMGMENIGKPVILPGSITPENPKGTPIGIYGRSGPEYFPQGTGGVPMRTAKGAPIRADNLEEYTIPDSQGKPTKNTVVRTKDTKEIVPNNVIQGVVRPDPMVQMMMENFARQGQDQQSKTGKTWPDLIVNWFNKSNTAAAATPAPTPAQAAPATSAGKPLDQQTAAALLQEAGGDPEKARQLARDRGYTF